jgi:drug/metabolite transporter (DMT)-like permease
LLATFWGYILYDEIPNDNTIGGATLIIIAGFLIIKIKRK